MPLAPLPTRLCPSSKMGGPHMLAHAATQPFALLATIDPLLMALAAVCFELA